LAERRYGHYVRGTREPDFQTLLRICSVLGVTPNDLLVADAASRRRVSDHDRWLSRFVAAAQALDANDVKLAARQIEAIAEHRGGRQS
jgi:hypothetical protein